MLELLGYDKNSWDNESGEEKEPWIARQFWTSLTTTQRAAASYLGYTETLWDDASGVEPQPAVFDKYWDEMTSCGGSASVDSF